MKSLRMATVLSAFMFFAYTASPVSAASLKDPVKKDTTKCSKKTEKKGCCKKTTEKCDKK